MSGIVKVLGFWEQGWNTPILEYDLLHFPVAEYEVQELIMSPVSGIAKQVTEVSGIDDALKMNPDLTPVFVDEKGETPMQDFEHPEDALYILGKASYSPYKRFEGTHPKSVRVETPTNRGRMWAHQAMCLVLYDRFIKNGPNNN
ncbi:MAG: hypothetical protein KAJ03_06770 [Gammaproteobacteria bacterium]|nr:hypothetical protein [Gammaproteobacteria bacterium]